MRHVKKCFCVIAFIQAALIGEEREERKADVFLKKTDANFVSLDKRVEPYLLPDSHPIKPSLDQIFSTSRAIFNLQSMKKAGFLHPKTRKHTRLVVTRHPALPGYLIKTYLDVQRHRYPKPEQYAWIRRIEGAQAIEALIQEKGWGHLFKTPKKWIYRLPISPEPPPEFVRKNFILIVEDMDIYDKETNELLWGSEAVTKETLDALYFLLEELGLHDCAKPDNIPFCKDGKIAFIDTQSLYEWPISYQKLSPYLSPSLKAYWKRLIKR